MLESGLEKLVRSPEDQTYSRDFIDSDILKKYYISLIKNFSAKILYENIGSLFFFLPFF